MWIVLVVACKDQGFGPLSGDGLGGSELDSADGANDDSGTLVPAYWMLGAKLALVDGEPEQASSTLTVRLFDEDFSSVICEGELVVKDIHARLSPDPAIYAWWTFGVEPDADCDSGATEFDLGIGEMNPDVETGIPALGYDDVVASALNGAYFGADDTTQWAFGVAGPTAVKTGGGEAAESAPLADGAWFIDPVYAFPL